MTQPEAMAPHERRALAVRLRDGDGLTFAAIGARLGVSVTRARDIVESGRRDAKYGLRNRSDIRCGGCARFVAFSWSETKGACTYPVPPIPNPNEAPRWLRELAAYGGPVNITSGAQCAAFQAIAKEPT